MSPTTRRTHRRPEHGWPGSPDGTGETQANEVWAKLRHAFETGTVLETLVALTTPEVAIAARLRVERAALEQEIAALEDDLDHARCDLIEARSRVSDLEREVEALRTNAALGEGPGERLYRRVGLHEAAPAWVVAAVRRAYRAKLHPDAHPASRKAEAERRFKEAEGIFDQIAKLRGST